jgi:hypothetical protein
MEKSLELTFTESEKTKKPIARTTDGKICILDFNTIKSKKVKAGETWSCEIISNDINKTIVKPIDLLITAEQNKVIFDAKLMELKSKFSKS